MEFMIFTIKNYQVSDNLPCKAANHLVTSTEGLTAAAGCFAQVPY